MPHFSNSAHERNTFRECSERAALLFGSVFDADTFTEIATQDTHVVCSWLGLGGLGGVGCSGPSRFDPKTPTLIGIAFHLFYFPDVPLCTPGSR